MSALGPDDALAYDILRAIRRIVQGVTLHSRQLARDTGLTVPQLVCLRALLAADGPLTLAELARAVELSPATVTGLADRLARGGWVVRAPVPGDRRKLHLVLTDDGRARAQALPAPLHEAVLAKVGALPEADRARLLGALEEVVAILGVTGLDAAPMLVDGASVREA